MDELQEFCARMVGDRQAAAALTQTARGAGPDLVVQVRQALEGCRASAPTVAADGAEEPQAGLAGAVASELAAASARLPQRQREAIALRELIGLDHDQVAAVLGIDRAAVAPVLARSRMRLRAELRGTPIEPGACPERERTLRTATLRQDSEPVSGDDADWLIDHLGRCDECARAHAAMLEGAACYRGWRSPEPAPAGGPVLAARADGSVGSVGA